MGLWRNLFSSAYRAARAAEAAGNPELAAQQYALAGERADAVRMHLARAARAPDRASEIAALRDALHWAGDEPALVKNASAALGRALLGKALAEGVATARDRERVREAAALLAAGGEHREAGAALEKIEDYQAAANAYSAGGLLELTETALAADDRVAGRAHEARDAFADYELHLRLGRRDDARDALVRCLAEAPDRQHRRLLDELEARIITSGKVELRPRGRPAVVIAARPTAVLGRDPLCELALRPGSVSRHHASIGVVVDGATPRFTIRDAGSRNGVMIGGLPIAGVMPLAEHGQVELSEDCRLAYDVAGDPPVLVVTVASGLDRGRVLVVAAPGKPIDLSRVDLPGDLIFVDGRPMFGRDGGGFTLADAPIATGRVQLIVGDTLTIDGLTIEVGG
jgi:pSer/pThr/pTyr-binding forkhead associated (FHA) protein